MAAPTKLQIVNIIVLHTRLILKLIQVQYKTEVCLLTSQMKTIFDLYERVLSNTLTI